MQGVNKINARTILHNQKKYYNFLTVLATEAYLGYLAFRIENSKLKKLKSITYFFLNP